MQECLLEEMSALMLNHTTSNLLFKDKSKFFQRKIHLNFFSWILGTKLESSGTPNNFPTPDVNFLGSDFMRARVTVLTYLSKEDN